MARTSEGRSISIGTLAPGLLVAMLAGCGSPPPAHPDTVRFATFNTSLSRTGPGELTATLAGGANPQARTIARVIQRIRPDVIVLQEFDYDPEGRSLAHFHDDYLARSQEGEVPLTYEYRWHAEVNTGQPTGFDLDGDGWTDGPEDAHGFGQYPGHFGMALFSRFPLDPGRARTFRLLRWEEMPRSRLPTSYYSNAAPHLRLSSKSHWDIPVLIGSRVVHVLASHPSPPVFDGPEDRNGRRNHDELRFWVDYISPGRDRWIHDDLDRRGGLDEQASFMFCGDWNADPYDGDSHGGAVGAILSHRRVHRDPAPTSDGGREWSLLQDGANRDHHAEPASDTADFPDRPTDSAPGNLRVDYVLPSVDLVVRNSGVFWPPPGDNWYAGRDAYGGLGSDHRLVWLDIAWPGF